MKGKNILALLLAVSMMTTNGSIAFAAKEKIDDKEETVSVQNTSIIQDEVPTCGTKEQTDWEYELVSENEIRLTEYKGSDADVVIPSVIDGKTVTQLQSDLFLNNTIIESVTIPATVYNMGGTESANVFCGASSLHDIYVEDENYTYYDIDGVLFRYGASSGLPMLIKYPEGKTGESYKVPDGVNYICMYAFNKCTYLKKVVIPSSVTNVYIWAFCDVTDMDIILQQTESSQINLVDGSFIGLINCNIIVKNETMKTAVEQEVAGHTPMQECSNTTVKIESELSAEEQAEYLTPATDLTFSDGSTVKDVTLMPESAAKSWWDGNNLPPEDEDDYYWQNINYTITPEDTTDTVTWTSNNPDVAVAKSVNGRSVVMGFSDGKATITGTTESGKQITLNVTVQTPVDKTELTYNGSVNPKNVTIDYEEFYKWVYFDIYPYNATYRENVTWESSNPEIISVKESEKSQVDNFYSHEAALTLNKPGTATITATLTPTDGSNPISRSVTINVTKEEDVQNETGAEENNENAGANADAGNNTDDSKDTGSNTDNGANGNKDSNTVKPAAKSSQKITNVSSFYKKAYKTSFTLKPKAKTSCTYKSSNTKIATVNSKGKVTIKGTGKVTITITAKETSKYKKATKKVTIYAIPAKMKTPSVKAGSKKLTVSWKKDSRADGYRIQYSTSSKFKNAKTVTCSKKTAKTTIKKLKSGKKYYVRIRAYKKIGSKKYYGSYSKTKSVKVK